MTCIDLALLDHVTGGLLDPKSVKPLPSSPIPGFPQPVPPDRGIQPGRPTLPNAPIHIGPLPPDFRSA